MLNKNCVSIRFKTDDFASLVTLLLAVDDNLVQDCPELLPHVAAVAAALGRNGYSPVTLHNTQRAHTRTLAAHRSAR